MAFDGKDQGWVSSIGLKEALSVLIGLGVGGNMW